MGTNLTVHSSGYQTNHKVLNSSHMKTRLANWMATSKNRICSTTMKLR